VTETTDLLNAGEVVEAVNQAWTLSHAGPAIRAKYSAFLKGRARAELAEQQRQGVFSGDGHRESLVLLNEEMTAGAYNWGSPLDPDGMGSAVRASLQQTDGLVKLLTLLLEKTHGQVSAEQARAILTDRIGTADNPSPVTLAIRACLSVGTPDPNSTRPVRTTGNGATGSLT
jgi:hypothetical protein